MSTTSNDFPADQVSEADWAEQHTEADPAVDDEPRVPPARLAAAEVEADEADLVDQETVAYVEDDDQR